MGIGKITLEWCYLEEADFGGALLLFFYTTPPVIWYMLIGVAFYSKQIYLQLLALTFYLSIAVSYVLQYIIAEKHPKTSCNNQGYANPAWEIQLVFSFVVCMLIHRIYWIRAVCLSDFLRGLILCVLIPLWLVLGKNYTIFQAVMGAMVGCLIAVFMSQAIYLIWIDRMDVFIHMPIIRWFGYKNNLSVYTTGPAVHKENNDMTNELMSPIDDQELSRSSRLTYPIRISPKASEKVRSYHQIEVQQHHLSRQTSVIKSAAQIASEAFLGHSIFDD